jgi:putative restriction endonuclease
MIELITWRRGDRRAPHKPLLILLALKSLQGGHRWISWDDVKVSLSKLLRTFGHDLSPKPHYPFIRLRTDGFWLIQNSEYLEYNISGDATLASLDRINPKAGFSDEFIWKYTEQHGPDWILRLVDHILWCEFPETIHEDIIQAIGLSILNDRIVLKRNRSKEFREQVLELYNYECAICGYSGSLKGNSVGVEAAHIKWFNYGGPDHFQNGLALCNMHHKLLDVGAIGISDDYRVLVSPKFSGRGIKSIVLDYNGSAIKLPRQRSFATEPEIQYIQWQRREVFEDWA